MISITPQLVFYAEIDDTGQILARSRRSVASSRVALDLPYWAMRSASYCLTHMAFEMAHDAGACFSFVHFMSCITIAKQPCYGPLKISRAILLFINMLLVSSYIIAAHQKQSMPFWLSLPTVGERLL